VKRPAANWKKGEEHPPRHRRWLLGAKIGPIDGARPRPGVVAHSHGRRSPLEDNQYARTAGRGVPTAWPTTSRRRIVGWVR
jgi:hypothetical protein